MESARYEYELFIVRAAPDEISAWPTLARWALTLRTDELRRRDVEAAAEAWARLDRGTGGLLDAVEFAEIKAWRQTEMARELGQSAEVVAFLAASEQALRATQRSYHQRRTVSMAMRSAVDRPSCCRTRYALPRSSQC